MNIQFPHWTSFHAYWPTTVSLGKWQDAYQKASTFVSQLTTAQKLQLITGNDVNTTTANGKNTTFTALQFLDGSMGLQDYFYVSAFSQSSALAMTWDKDAMYAQARAVATEFYLKGIQVVDGPTTQPLGRTPWGGRLVETFGPDPYLNGVATGLSTRAYVDTGVVAGAKVCSLPSCQVSSVVSNFLAALYSQRARNEPN